MVCRSIFSSVFYLTSLSHPISWTMNANDSSFVLQWREKFSWDIYFLIPEYVRWPIIIAMHVTECEEKCGYKMHGYESRQPVWAWTKTQSCTDVLPYNRSLYKLICDHSLRNWLRRWWDTVEGEIISHFGSDFDWFVISLTPTNNDVVWGKTDSPLMLIHGKQACWARRHLCV